MEQTIRQLARVMGASAVECAGHDSRMVVMDEGGGRLQVSIEGGQQRLMAVLKDKDGNTRTTVDLAPVTHVTEDKAFPNRVTLHVGRLLVHFDSIPTLAIELATAETAA